MTPTPQSALAIVNPSAGGGRASRAMPWLRERLGPWPEARIEVTGRPGDAESLAAGAAADDVLLVAIANGAYYGGGMRIAPDAHPDDGLLDVCIVGDISRMTAIRQLPSLYRGTHVRHPQVSLFRGRSIEVDGDAATRVHLDGEPFGSLPLRVAIHAGALEVAGSATPPTR